MADVTALCERIIIIHHGQLKYDGGITDLSRRIAPFKLIGVALLDGADRPEPLRHADPNENNDGKRLMRCRPTRSPPSLPACWPICPCRT